MTRSHSQVYVTGSLTFKELMFLALERILLFPFVRVLDEETFMKTSILPHEETKLVIILNDILRGFLVEV